MLKSSYAVKNKQKQKTKKQPASQLKFNKD